MDIGNKAVFFGLLCGFIIMRGLFAWVAQRSGLSPAFENDDPAHQEEQKIRPSGMLVILCILALFVSYAIIPESRNILVIHFPVWLHGLGLALGIISLALQIWVHSTLQKNWSTARESGRNNLVIASGLYRWIRHPL